MALITPTQVVDIAFTNKNTDKYLVKPAFVEIAELNFIQPAIGEELYESILNDKATNVAWNSSPALTDTITCSPDASGLLQGKYFTFYTANNAQKIAVYIDYSSLPIIPPPPGYDDVIQVALSATPNPTALDNCVALTTALNNSPYFTATNDSVSKVFFVRPEFALAPTVAFPIMSNMFSFTTNGAFAVTAGTNILACPANAFIAVGDFVSGVDIPLKEDGTGSCRALNKVLTVNTPGAVTSFTISGTPTTTDSTSIVLFQKPNGKLVDGFIINYLAFAVRFEMIPDMAYNTTSQGLVESTSSFSLPVDAKTLGFMRTETYKKSETYLRKMKSFLIENSLSYPLYCDDSAEGVSKLNGIILY